jgi:hypothetical protein
MTTQWLVARYVRDLRRMEPRNVGVVLIQHGRAYSKFLGENPDGTIDGRKARRVAALDVYKEWVDHWKREVAEAPNVERLTERQGADSYYLDRGGFAWFAGEDHEPRAFLDRLFNELVAPPSVEDVPDRAAISVGSVFDALSGDLRVRRDFEIRLDPDRLHFQYAIEADRVLVFRTVKLNGQPGATWSAVHDAVYSVNTVRGLNEWDPYALVVESDPSDEAPDQLKTLVKALPKRVIHVHSQRGAVETIRALALAKGG